MKSVLATVIALGLAASCAFAQQLTINTPTNAATCEPLMITWSGGTPPYDVNLLPGNAPTGTPLISFNATSANSLTWLVSEAVGTSLGLNVRDSTGTFAQSAAFTVIAGVSTTCVGSTTSVSYASTAAGGATSTGQSPSASAATTSGSNTATNSPTSTTPGASAGTTTHAASTASSTASHSAAASHVTGQIAAAGIIGAAIVALLG